MMKNKNKKSKFNKIAKTTMNMFSDALKYSKKRKSLYRNKNKY